MSVFYRSVAVGAIGALSLAVGGVGIATAANGGSLLLGRSNHATKVTTLTDHKGTPLSLVGKTSKPPLKVNSSKEVTHLNASLLGGKTAGDLETSGSAGQYRYTGQGVFLGISIGMLSSPTEVAKTASLAAGTYYVTASAETRFDGSGTSDLACRIAPDGKPNEELATGVNTTTGFATENEETLLTVTAPETLAEYCYSTAGSAVYYESGIYAVKIAHSRAGSAPAPTN